MSGRPPAERAEDALAREAEAAQARDAELAAAAAALERTLFDRPWSFVLSAPHMGALPPAALPEVAFAGRSNVGKSSLVNALANRKGLAKSSNTPGRTRALNYFRTGGDLLAVDMPGYGYAKAPKKEVEAWTRLVFDYLRGRPSLARVFLLVDARHGLKPNDREAMDRLDEAAVPYQVVLTKTDKIAAPEREKVLAATLEALARRPAAHPVVIATSAATREGLDALRAAIAEIAAIHGASPGTAPV